MPIVAHRRRGLRRAPAAATLALALAHGAAAEAPLAGARFVCAHYDAERAVWTGTVAVLEPAAGAAAAVPADGTAAAHRLLVLDMREDAPRAAAPALTVGEALALLANAQAALGEGRAAREEFRGRVAHDRERNRLHFTGADARAMPRTMTVFTVPGLAIVESGAARSRRSDGPYRCAAPPPRPGALLPAHCAERRAGRMDLDAFPAPRAEVRLIQSALERAGLTPGPIDGIFGPRTLAALERWSERTGRAPGRIFTYGTLCPLLGTSRATDTP